MFILLQKIKPTQQAERCIKLTLPNYDSSILWNFEENLQIYFSDKLQPISRFNKGILEIIADNHITILDILDEENDNSKKY